MKNRSIRDDFMKGRLYPFFLAKANLDIDQLMVINARVFFIKTKDNQAYILKSHRRINRLKQQWAFFKQTKSSKVIIPFVVFPNGQLFIDDKHVAWTITPYIKGRKLHFNDQADRLRAVQTLKQFHKDASAVFPKEPVLQEVSWLIRLEKRLRAFMRTAYFFEKYGYNILYQDIVDMMNHYLDLAAQIPWESLEHEASRYGKWIHRDVASHNFIMSHKSNNTSLIDFDLLTIGSQLQDYIQLAQRFLPYIQWDLERILKYEMVPHHLLSFWLKGVLIPSDVVREWLYIVTHATRASIHRHIKRMEADWERRRHFLQKAEIMLKSL